ncbi:MAG TPA: hypothetical protein VFI82_10360 [Terriglobales bacterium]|jgi:hypothetical protein|nr:hypothetical protein [Terriglobales bacterium]
MATAPMQTDSVNSGNVPQLAKHKIKIKKPGQRACNEKDAKGKLCGGHLKRWFYTSDVLEKACGDVEQAFGPNAEIYRCEHCRTLYLPNPKDPSGLNVAGRGEISTFGLTLPPKDTK